MDSAINNWIKNNNKFLAVLYIILVIIILFSLFDINEAIKFNKKVKEGFQVTTSVEDVSFLGSSFDLSLGSVSRSCFSFSASTEEYS